MRRVYLAGILLTTSLLMTAPAMAQGGGTDDPKDLKPQVTNTKKSHPARTGVTKKTTKSKAVTDTDKSSAVSK